MAEKSEEEGSEADDFAVTAFQEWLRITAQGFQDHFELEKATEIMRPYSINAGIALANNASKMLGLEAKGIENLAYEWEFLDFSVGIVSQTEITEFGTRTIATSCPFHNGPAILCINHFDQGPDAWAHFMVPEIMHGKFIEALYEGKGRCFGHCSQISDLGRILGAKPIKTIKITNMDPVKKRAVQSLILTDWWEFFLSMFVDQVGSQKVVELLGPKFYDLGAQDWKRFNEEYGIGTGHVEINELMEAFSKMFGRESRPIVQKKDSLHGEILKCPFSNCLVEMCLLIGEYLKGLCHEADPGSRFSYVKMMTKGDPICIWRIDRGVGKKEMEGSRNKDDLIYRLKQRLVNGEITKEEYKELYSLITE
ncbi:MAG: hypothetical protein LUQ09_05850 [Methanomassiliicoccales archaeon]|nr:hypothetical protein [Methanomassiliicoccales archaeon]